VFLVTFASERNAAAKSGSGSSFDLLPRLAAAFFPTAGPGLMGRIVHFSGEGANRNRAHRCHFCVKSRSRHRRRTVSELC
jgi:hypothetical protein